MKSLDYIFYRKNLFFYNNLGIEQFSFINQFTQSIFKNGTSNKNNIIISLSQFPLQILPFLKL